MKYYETDFFEIGERVLYTDDDNKTEFGRIIDIKRNDIIDLVYDYNITFDTYTVKLDSNKIITSKKNDLHSKLYTLSEANRSLIHIQGDTVHEIYKLNNILERLKEYNENISELISQLEQPKGGFKVGEKMIYIDIIKIYTNIINNIEIEREKLKEYSEYISRLNIQTEESENKNFESKIFEIGESILYTDDDYRTEFGKIIDIKRTDAIDQEYGYTKEFITYTIMLDSNRLVYSTKNDLHSDIYSLKEANKIFTYIQLDTTNQIKKLNEQWKELKEYNEYLSELRSQLNQDKEKQNPGPKM